MALTKPFLAPESRTSQEEGLAPAVKEFRQPGKPLFLTCSILCHPLFGERLFAEETGEAFKDGRGHVGMRRRAGAGLNEQVTVFLQKVLIHRSTAVSKKCLLAGPR